MSEQEISFETAFARLEDILEKMNTGALSLEESLHLYEEADALILLCNKRLVHAEQKIEMLMKNREGQLQLSEQGSPLTQPFSLSTSHTKS